MPIGMMATQGGGAGDGDGLDYFSSPAAYWRSDTNLSGSPLVWNEYPGVGSCTLTWPSTATTDTESGITVIKQNNTAFMAPTVGGTKPNIANGMTVYVVIRLGSSNDTSGRCSFGWLGAGYNPLRFGASGANEASAYRFGAHYPSPRVTWPENSWFIYRAGFSDNDNELSHRIYDGTTADEQDGTFTGSFPGTSFTWDAIMNSMTADSGNTRVAEVMLLNEYVDIGDTRDTDYFDHLETRYADILGT